MVQCDCGNEFERKSGTHKWCETCKVERRRKQLRDAQRKHRANNPDPEPDSFVLGAFARDYEVHTDVDALVPAGYDEEFCQDEYNSELFDLRRAMIAVNWKAYIEPVYWDAECMVAWEKIKVDGCENCGSHRGLQRDHWIPRARGGEENVDNLVCLCAECNRTKSDVMPHQFFSAVTISRIERRLHG